MTRRDYVYVRVAHEHLYDRVLMAFHEMLAIRHGKLIGSDPYRLMYRYAVPKDCLY
jgi:hypothetical protein